MRLIPEDPAKSGKEMEVLFGIKNTGNHHLRAISVTIIIADLGIKKVVSLPDLSKDERKDILINVLLPKDSMPGMYDLLAIASAEDKSSQKYGSFEII